MSAMPIPQSDAFKRSLELARRVAADFRSHYVEVIHLFIAILREHPQLVADVVGTPVSELLIEAGEQAALRPHRKIRPDEEALPFGAECLRAIEHAEDESALAGQKLVLPIHGLSAILNERGTNAAQIMKKHGLTLNKLRARYVWSEKFPDNEL